MKKLVMAAVVGIIAATSQAYEVRWGAINVKTPVAADVAVAQSGITGTGSAMSGLAINLFWVSTSGDEFIGTYNVSDGKVSTVALGDGTSSAIYTAMVADHGTTWKPVYHMTATYATSDGTYTFDGTVTSSLAIGDLSTKNIGATANFGSIAGWSYTPVPEPTSGLLVLLGVAGLALRRRRA
jgi:hypothetical protein